MPKRIQFRRDTADNWTFHNPRLMPGEIGLETDTQKFKIGDGDLDWEDLPYYLSLDAQVGALDDAVTTAVESATNAAEGYKDAAITASESAAADATAADGFADVASAAASAATAVGTTNDTIVAALVADDDSDTNDAIVSLVSSANTVIVPNLSGRPAPGTPGLYCLDSSTGLLYLDTGTAWVTINSSARLSGEMVTFGGAAAPSGWLLCDGTTRSRTTYASLFAAIGTSYGAGDGSTTFAVPDMRGRLAMGQGTNGVGVTHAIGAKGGEDNHQLSLAEMPTHDHGGSTGLMSSDHAHSGTTDGVGDHTHSYPANSPTSSTVQTAGGIGTVADDVHFGDITNPAGAHAHSFATGGANANHNHSISGQGSSTAHNNLPPYTVVNYIIKI